MEDIGLHLQICELNTLVAGMILYYGYLTGKELSLAEFLEYNKEEFPSVQKIHEQLGRDLFAHQEQAGIHNPYEQERREQDAIRHGDVAALNRSISETYEGKIGQLAKNPLRHHKMWQSEISHWHRGPQWRRESAWKNLLLWRTV